MNTPTPYPVGTRVVVVAPFHDTSTGKPEISIAPLTGTVRETHSPGVEFGDKSGRERVVKKTMQTVEMDSGDLGMFAPEYLRPIQDPDAEPITETRIAETEQ